MPTKRKKVDLLKIFEQALGPENTSRASAILEKFPPGQHTGNIISSLANYVPDIRGLLHYLAATYRPKAYLEIGVRLGYSMAMVAGASPETSIVGVDMWVVNYGGESNGSFKSVEDRLRAMGCANPIRFLNGNSHIILPQWFKDHPKERFDLILVDADHDYKGALQDLRDCLPRLEKGGFLIFDDLHDPALQHAWQQIQGEFKGMEYFSQGIVGLIYRR